MLFKSWEQLLAIRRFGGLYRTLVTDVKVENDAVPPKRKYQRRKQSEKRSKDMLAYFDTPERKSVLELYPDNMLRKKSKIPDALYNTSETAARTIVDHLIKDLPPERPLLEVFPGRGAITKLLLKETENPLILYEPEDIFHKGLNVSSSALRSVCCDNFLKFIIRQSSATLQTGKLL